MIPQGLHNILETKGMQIPGLENKELARERAELCRSRVGKNIVSLSKSQVQTARGTQPSNAIAL
jgi:hypothetical protein